MSFNQDLQELMKSAEIAAPCSANWDQMTGDDKMRFCSECKLHVVSAAAMTDEEVLAALQRAVQGEEVCMKIYRRADGTFLTKDCPVGVQRLRERAAHALHRARQAARYAAGWLSGLLAMMLSCAAVAAPGGQSKSGPDSGTGSSNGNSTECGGKPKWHSNIKADTPSNKQNGNGGIAVEPVVPTRPRYQREFMGRIAVASDEQVAKQEQVVAYAKKHSSDPKQIATALDRLAHLLRYKNQTARLAAVHAELLPLYDELKDPARAALTCMDLANLYAFGLRDQAKASSYRIKADQYHLKSSAESAKLDAELVAKLAGYEQTKNWTAANNACADVADSLHASGAMRNERASYWALRAEQYATLISPGTSSF